MIIAFDWTSRALVAGHKWVTRREWATSHRERFTAYQQVDAWDKSPRAHGQRIATIELIESPMLQTTNLMTDDDYAAEGFPYLMRFPGETIEDRAEALRIASPENFASWRRQGVAMTVVRFRLVSVLPAGIALLNDAECRELCGRLSLTAASHRHFPEPARRAILAAAAAEPFRIHHNVTVPLIRSSHIPTEVS